MFTPVDVAVPVAAVAFVTVIAPLHESDGKLDDALPVDWAKYQIPAVHVTVLVLPLKLQLELAI